MATSPRSPAPDWTAGAVAGLVAGLVVGIGLAVVDPAVVETHVPEALGARGAPAGLAVLAVLGLGFGLGYAVLGSVRPVGRLVDRPRTGGAVGLAYGLLLWIVAIVTVPLLVGAGVDAIGEIAVTAPAAVAFALLGSLIGVGYLAVRAE